MKSTPIFESGGRRSCRTVPPKQSLSPRCGHKEALWHRKGISRGIRTGTTALSNAAGRVAVRAGLSERQVRQLIQTGQLEHVYIGC